MSTFNATSAADAFPLSLDAGPEYGSAAAPPEPTLRRSARNMSKCEFSDSMDIDPLSSSPTQNKRNSSLADLFTAAVTPPPKRALTEAEAYAQHLLTPLPAVLIPAITNPDYESHNATLASNINFQARVRRSGGIRALYPDTAVDEVMRLYYPDYQSWDRILNEGIINRMGVPSVDDIVGITLIVKRRGWEEEDNQGEKLEIRPENADWDNMLARLRERGVGANVGSGLRGAHTVKLLIKLAN